MLFFDNTLYAYVKSDEGLMVYLYNVLISYASGIRQAAVTITVTGPDGEGWECSVKSTQGIRQAPFPLDDTEHGGNCESPLLEGEGIWTISVHDDGPSRDEGVASAVYRIDAHVMSPDGEQHGRVFADMLGMTQKRSGTSYFSFYSIDEDGYEYRIDLNRYQGVDSTFLINGVGVPTDVTGCKPSYRSALGTNMTPGVTNTQTLASCGMFHLFFEPIDQSMPEYADSAAGRMYLNPALATVDLSFVRSDPSSVQGTFTVNESNETMTGTYDLQIDADNNGTFTDPWDRIIPVHFPGGTGNHDVRVDFDGLDGRGNPIPITQTFSAHLKFGHTGEIHMVAQDVEILAGGIGLTKLNGPQAGDATVHWDDSHLGMNTCGNIADSPCIGTKPDPLVTDSQGIDSSDGAHRWNPGSSADAGTDYGWGDGRSIDTWAYSEGIAGDATTTVEGATLGITKEALSDDSQVLPGSVVAYQVTVTNTSDIPIDESNPAMVADDLADVLDDATYNDDVSATSGTATMADGVLSWAGALSPGETSVITYSVTVKPYAEQNDHTLNNVAAMVSYPDPVLPVECAPGEAACSSVSLVLPAPEPEPGVRVDIAADRDSATQAGEEIVYTVTVTNSGNVTLEKVDVTASGVVLDGCEELGPLAAGETISCTGTYRVTEQDVDAGHIENVVRVTGTASSGEPVSAQSSVTVEVESARVTSEVEPPADEIEPTDEVEVAPPTDEATPPTDEAPPDADTSTGAGPAMTPTSPTGGTAAPPSWWAAGLAGLLAVALAGASAAVRSAPGGRHSRLRE